MDSVYCIHWFPWVKLQQCSWLNNGLDLVFKILSIKFSCIHHLEMVYILHACICISVCLMSVCVWKHNTFYNFKPWRKGNWCFYLESIFIGICPNYYDSECRKSWWSWKMRFIQALWKPAMKAWDLILIFINALSFLVGNLMLGIFLLLELIGMVA